MSDIITLVQSYSFSDIIVFIVLLALSIKAFVSFWDWGKNKLREVFKKESQENKTTQDVDNNSKRISEIEEKEKKINNDMQEIRKMIKALIDSDKDDIKAWITEKHHHFCYEKRQIDDYSLDCIERRYTHYIEEGGNSFVHDLMEDIRALPKTSDGSHNF